MAMMGRAAFGSAAAAAWLPSEREMARSRLAAAMKRWGYASLAELQRVAVAKPDWFWRAALDDLGVTFTTPWTDLVDTSGGRAFPRWFVGGRLNVATHCVERHAADSDAADRIAVTYEGDRLGEPELLKFPTASGDGEGWLVIDDLVDTGTTMRIIRGILPKAHVGVLYAKPVGRPLAHTFIREFPPDSWIDFPWEMAAAFGT